MKYIFVICAIFTTFAASANAQQTTEQTTTNTEPGVVQQNNALVEQYAEPGSEVHAVINQQNTIIHHHPTPTPEPVIVNENVSVDITDNVTTVRPGEEVVYRITLRNHLHQDVDNVLVRIQVPKFFIPGTTEPEANTSDPSRRVIEWKHQQISAGSEISYILRGNAENGAPNRAELVARVLVNGPGVHHTDHDLTTIISGAIAGIAAGNPGPQTIHVIEPAAIDVRPTAKTGNGPLALVAGLALTTTGFITTKRFLI